MNMNMQNFFCDGYSGRVSARGQNIQFGQYKNQESPHKDSEDTCVCVCVLGSHV